MIESIILYVPLNNPKKINIILLVDINVDFGKKRP